MSGSGGKGEWRKTHLETAEKPITTNSLQKWKTELSKTEISIAESICAPGMQWLGYPRSTPEASVNATTRIKWKLGKTFAGLYWQLAERKGDGQTSWQSSETKR